MKNNIVNAAIVKQVPKLFNIFLNRRKQNYYRPQRNHFLNRKHATVAISPEKVLEDCVAFNKLYSRPLMID